MLVPINIPDRLWEQAARGAERKGTKLADLIVQTVLDAATDAPRREPRAAVTQRQTQVAELHAQGLTDKEIAGHLGLSLYTARNVRGTQLRLQPNPKHQEPA